MGKPNPIDVHVGAQLRLRRTWLGMSQEKLGDAIGLTFQQVQKYERGVNRIGASRLYELSDILDVPVGFFFDGLPRSRDMSRGPGLSEAPAAAYDPGTVNRESLELARAYKRIADTPARRSLFDLIKAIAQIWPEDA
jgi:transcriptional regulator with XRE-family HTH domain